MEAAPGWELRRAWTRPSSTRPSGLTPFPSKTRHSRASDVARRHAQHVSITEPLDEHPNASAYRQTAAAFRARDWSAISALIHPDVVWHIPGTHELAGDLTGREAITAFLTRLNELGFWLAEHDVFGNDVHVCALSEMGVRRPEKTVSTRVVNIFHYRDGRQLERWIYPEDMAAWDSILQPM